MNNKQKIIITIYLISSIIVGFFSSYILTILNGGIYDKSSEIVVGSFITIPFFFIFFGIITFILYKLWADKK